MMDRPLYRALAERIELRITAGNYAVGSQLPTEPELEREFGVSRITIRQALGLLKRRGLLASKSGLGTIVRSAGTEARAMTMSGSMRDLTYYAAGTGYTPLGRSLITPTRPICTALKLSIGSDVVCFRGLRARPPVGNFGLEEVYIPELLARGLDNARLGSTTLFSRLEEENNFSIAEVEQIITAVAAPAAVATELALVARTPMLKATRIYRLADGQPVELAVSYYDVRKFEYVMKLFPE
jgi:GntR family transcriptional regulator